MQQGARKRRIKDKRSYLVPLDGNAASVLDAASVELVSV